MQGGAYSWGSARRIAAFRGSAGLAPPARRSVRLPEARRVSDSRVSPRRFSLRPRAKAVQKIIIIIIKKESLGGLLGSSPDVNGVYFRVIPPVQLCRGDRRRPFPPRPAERPRLLPSKPSGKNKINKQPPPLPLAYKHRPPQQNSQTFLRLNPFLKKKLLQKRFPGGRGRGGVDERGGLDLHPPPPAPLNRGRMKRSELHVQAKLPFDQPAQTGGEGRGGEGGALKPPLQIPTPSPLGSFSLACGEGGRRWRKAPGNFSRPLPPSGP